MGFSRQEYWSGVPLIPSLSHSVVFLYFFALIAEEGFLISSCYSLELYPNLNNEEAQSFRPDGTQECIHAKLHVLYSSLLVFLLRYHKGNLTENKLCTWTILHKM